MCVETGGSNGDVFKAAANPLLFISRPLIHLGELLHGLSDRLPWCGQSARQNGAGC